MSKSKKDKTVLVSIDLPQDTLSWLYEYAEERGVSVEECTIGILKANVKAKKESKGIFDRFQKAIRYISE